MIVVTKHHNTIMWYESDSDYWILDHQDWADSFVAAGFVDHTTDFSERFGIPVVDENTAVEFLAQMEEFRVSRQQLGKRFEQVATSSEFEFEDYLPVLFVDFDARKVWSQHPESTSYIDHVPSGWTGEYRGFFAELPEQSRYWVNASGDSRWGT